MGQNYRCVGVLCLGLFLGSSQLCPGAESSLAETRSSGGGDLENLADLSLEQLSTIKVDTVFGASRHDQKTTEAPSSVSIVTQDDIKKYGYRSLADVLNSVRGFCVTYDRGYHNIGVRGFNRPGDFGCRVLLMVNGHRLNDGGYDLTWLA